MKNKKTMFTLIMATLLGMSSCGKKGQNSEYKSQEKQRLETFYFDSLLNEPNTIAGKYSANEADSILFDENTQNQKSELEKLTNLHQSDNLHQEILDSSKPIMDKWMKSIMNSLAAFNIKSNKPIQNLEYSMPEYGADLSDTVFIGSELFNMQKYFVDTLFETFDISNKFGDKQQIKIKKIIENHYLQMMAELKKNRLNIAKKYAKYYPELDIPEQYKSLFDDPAIQTFEDWTFIGDYTSLEQNTIAVQKSVHVYDSKLKPEFFRTPGAKYRLVKLAPYKWQIVKTLKSGKVEKTHIFSDSVDYKISGEFFGPEEQLPQAKTFETEAGKNMGVHIRTSEILWIKRPTENDAVPGDPERIKQLEEINKEMNKLDSASRQYHYDAKWLAIQLAKKKMER